MAFALRHAPQRRWFALEQMRLPSAGDGRATGADRAPCRSLQNVAFARPQVDDLVPPLGTKVLLVPQDLDRVDRLEGVTRRQVGALHTAVARSVGAQAEGLLQEATHGAIARQRQGAADVERDARAGRHVRHGCGRE